MSTSPFSAEHEELRASIAAASSPRSCARDASAWEDARWFPDEVFARMAQLGFLGLKYLEAYGGQGGDHLHDAVLVEELARCGSGGLAAGIGAHVGIATPPVWKFGTEDQKERYSPPRSPARRSPRWSITEPGAGSDVAALRTRAQRVEGGWMVNGEKTYITKRARALPRHRRADQTAGRPPRHQLPDRRPPGGGHVGQARKARLAMPRTPRRSPSTTCSCPRRTCSAPSTRASS